ncbi:hypothetical protein HYV89_05070 [Candidatus Woesearchaeota archaeon]|nr:hypothetical protein [Candidatus Woesearchaeota archaeon]
MTVDYKSKPIMKLEEVMENQADLLEHSVYEMIKSVYEDPDLHAKAKFEEIRSGIKKSLSSLVALNVRPRFYAALYGIMAPYYSEEQRERIWEFFSRVASNELTYIVNADKVFAELPDKKLEDNLVRAAGKENQKALLPKNDLNPEDKPGDSLEWKIAAADIYKAVIRPEYLDKNGKILPSKYVILNNVSISLRGDLLRKVDGSKGYYVDEKNIQKVVDYLCKTKPDLTRRPAELPTAKTISEKPIPKKTSSRREEFKSDSRNIINYQVARKNANTSKRNTVTSGASSGDLWGFAVIEKAILAEMPNLMKQEIKIARDDIEEILGRSAIGEVDDDKVKWSYKSAIEPNWYRILELFSNK